MDENKKEVVQEIPVQVQPSIIHKLKLINDDIYLDDFALKGVTYFDIQKQPRTRKELTLKLFVD